VARTPSPEYLILDIETVPDVERWQRPAPPPPPTSPDAPPPPPSQDRSGFPPIWAHRIIVIGCLWLDARYQMVQLDVIRDPAAGGSADDRERGMLAAFSRLVGKVRPLLVTYNGRSFDLPVIAMRSLCHAVPLGWYYRERDLRYRYSDTGHLDICDWLADHGATRAGKLDAVARLIGLPGKVGIDGSDVEPLYAAGQLGAIESYCLSDVAQTALLFLRFRLLQGQLAPERYRDRIEELIEALARDGRVNSVLEGLDLARLRGPLPVETA
jgi:predicted PolB exonuclease-like 3'-5' exonuclease